MLGLTGGIFNFITNLAGITTPWVVGHLEQYTHSNSAALFYVAALPLIGAFLYIFMLGDIKRLNID